LLFLLLTLLPPAPFSPAYAPFQTSVIEEAADSPIPDAEAAELKAIRDLREYAGTETAKPGKVISDGAARDKTVIPAPAPSHHAPRIERVVAEAAASMRKTWRRLTLKLGGS
jgi:hypothetical protein